MADVPISDGRFPHGEVITVVNRTVDVTKRDGAGNVVPAEAVPTEYIGAFDPAIGFESSDGVGGRVSTQPGAFLPYAAVVSPSSVLICRGDRYEVDGEPAYWRNPFTGDEVGVQVPLRRSTG